MRTWGTFWSGYNVCAAMWAALEAKWLWAASLIIAALLAAWVARSA